MRKVLVLALVFLISNAAISQDFSNKGKEFWLAYSYHVGMVNAAGGAPAMTLYLTSDVTTTYTVEIYGVTVIQAGTINANQVIPVVIPNTYFISVDGLVTGRAVHVTAAKPIVVYSFITRSQASAATLCLPTSVLGKEYYSSSFTQSSNENNASSYITIVGVEDNTTIEITVTDSTVALWPPNSTHTINLNKGEVYQVLGKTSGNNGKDLSGSFIKSIASGVGGCKRIAVFSGSGKLLIGAPAAAPAPACNGGSADNLYQQLYPVSSWGKKFLTVPSYGRKYNHFRVTRSKPLTNLYVNGVLIPAASFVNNYYQFFNNTPNLIEADEPISVSQYFTSQNCPNNTAPGGGNPSPYDPDMVILSPLEQSISNVTLVNSPLTVTPTTSHQHHLHVIMRDGGTGQSSFKYDLVPVPLVSWVPHPALPGYSYLYLSNVTAGNHNLVSDSGFNAIAYGYGNAETYAYSAGANVKDLTQQLELETQYGIETSPSVCTNSPFKFKLYFPDSTLAVPPVEIRFDSLRWELTNSTIIVPNNFSILQINPTIDSTNLRNGRMVNWYSLPGNYFFNAPAVDSLIITAYKTANDGCGAEQIYEFPIVITDPPAAGFSWTPGTCVAEPYQFTETTPQFPKPTYKFWWDFGDPASGVLNNAIIRNPTHTFTAPGTYTVRFSDITTPGCLSDTITQSVVVLPLPTATISGTTTLCINSAPPDITFTAADGTAPYTFTYNINGGAPLTVSTVGASTTATVSAPTNIAGTFIYTLTNVKNTGSVLCTQVIVGQTATVIIEPDHTISLSSLPATTNQTVCINTPILPITYTLGGGANGGTVTGLPAGVTSNVVGTTLTISGSPSTTVGSPFNYTITTTGNSCITANSSGTISVNPDHTITLSSLPATTSQAVCMNTLIIPITYTLSDGATGGTVTGLPAGVTSNVVGTTLTISGSPTTTVGSPFNYTVTTTGNACITASLSGTITVHQLPTPNFTYSALTCETGIIDFTDASVANSGNLASWAWDFGDPGSGINNTSSLQNPSHVFSTAGVYTVTLTVTTDLTCVNNGIYTQNITINDRPKAGYIIPEVCLSDTYAQFLDTSSIAAGTIVGWNWDFGDPLATIPNPNTSTLQNPTHSYTAVGNYTVQLIVTSAIGCKDTITHILTVNGSFPVANFTVNNPGTLCANDSIGIVDISTVFPGVITKVEIWWDDVAAGPPGLPEVDDLPFFGKTYKHLYPNFQAPLTKNYTIRLRAYSGGVCLNDKLGIVTINAAPKVQFNPIPDICLFALPYQITQASEIGGVPGAGVYSGPGVTVTGLFTPTVAGVGTHTIKYTFTSTTFGCVDTISTTIKVLDTATARFTYIAPICQSVPGSFTDVSTAPVTVSLTNTVWDFGDLTPIENHLPGATFNHMFPGPGTYLVKMYNVSAVGCNSTTYAELVTVDPDHIITLTSLPATTNQTVCINTAILPITYTLGGGATNATVTGLPAGVNFNVVGTTLTISGLPSTTLLSPYNYSISTLGNTCIVATATGTISVNPDHTIVLSSLPATTSQAVCVNSTIAPITYTLGGGATGAVVVGLPTGVIANVVGTTLTISGSPSITIGSPFNYTVTTTGNSCITASATGSITVNPYPVPKFAFDKPGYCIPNATVVFNNTSTIEDGTENAFTYLWNFGDPASGVYNTSSAKNPTHWFSTIGPFNINLNITSGAGCVHDTTIVLNTVHPQPKVNFSTSQPSVCIRDAVTFTDLTVSSDGAAINQWHWDLGDGSIRTTNPLTYTYTDTVTFNVTLYTINSFGCNSDTITKPFTVYPYPKVNAGPDRFILEGGSIVLESVTYGNDLQFEWTPNLYFVDNRIAKPRIIKPLTDMTYTLKVTARGGCALSDMVFVKLLKFPTIPNTFTPNNDGINDTWNIDYLNTYPDNRVQVFSRAGQLVFESRGYNKPWDGTMKGKPLPFDTYYYIIEPGSLRDPITGYVTIIK